MRAECDVTAPKYFLRIVFDVGIVRPYHFDQQRGGKCKDSGRIPALNEMADIVRLAHVVEQHVVWVCKKRAVHIPALIRARAR